jgi:hypothetical protein
MKNNKYRFCQILSISALVLTACTNKTPTPSTSPMSSPNTAGGLPANTTVTPSISPSLETKPIATPRSSPFITNPPNSDIYQVIDEAQKSKFTTQSKNLFKNTQLPNSKVQFNPLDLLAVLASTRQYFQTNLLAIPIFKDRAF